jgi:hypothetical protein
MKLSSTYLGIHEKKKKKKSQIASDPNVLGMTKSG